jgi:hypothetical protein
MLHDSVVRSSTVGDGDIQISSSTERTVFALSSPTGQATLWIDTPSLTNFLHLTYDMVPESMESERINWDAELSSLFEGGSW